MANELQGKKIAFTAKFVELAKDKHLEGAQRAQRAVHAEATPK